MRIPANSCLNDTPSAYLYLAKELTFLGCQAYILGAAQFRFIDHTDQHAGPRVLIRLDHDGQWLFGTETLHRRTNSAEPNLLAAIGHLSIRCNSENDAVLFQLACAGRLRFVNFDTRLFDKARRRNEKDQQEHDDVDQRNQVQLDRLIRFAKSASRSHAGTASPMAAATGVSVAAFGIAMAVASPASWGRKLRSVIPSRRARKATNSFRQRFTTNAAINPGIATIIPVCVATSA